MGFTGSVLVVFFSTIQTVRPNQMIRKAILLFLLVALASCSTPHEIPANDCPREGGIGGTGDCTTESEIT